MFKYITTKKAKLGLMKKEQSQLFKKIKQLELNNPSGTYEDL